MEKLIFVLILFGAANSWADPSCFPFINDNGNSSFYELTLHSHLNWTGPQDYVYMDQDLRKDARNCPSLDDDATFNKFQLSHLNFCINSCNDKMRVKKKDYKLSDDRFNHMREECQSFCRVDAENISNMRNGYKRGYRDGKADCSATNSHSDSGSSKHQ